MPLAEYLEADRREVDAALERLLPPADAPPAVIHRAMRYSVFAGGKRLRPILCVEAARLFAADVSAAIPVACAVEFIHTYSLIHDDLPALDNDDLRRGRPTCHVQFGEAMAILAGDALLTRAFETLAAAEIEPRRRVAIIRAISTAAGTVEGMVGGQVADLEAQGKPIEKPMLDYIHHSKTAALIRASVVSGAMAGGAADADVEHMRRFGESIGFAFQVVDDILDVEESSATLGKTAGKDLSQRKATFPALYGLEKSREIARRSVAEAHEELAQYGDHARSLHELADYLVSRRA